MQKVQDLPIPYISSVSPTTRRIGKPCTPCTLKYDHPLATSILDQRDKPRQSTKAWPQTFLRLSRYLCSWPNFLGLVGDKGDQVVGPRGWKFWSNSSLHTTMRTHEGCSLDHWSGERSISAGHDDHGNSMSTHFSTFSRFLTTLWQDFTWRLTITIPKKFPLFASNLISLNPLNPVKFSVPSKEMT